MFKKITIAALSLFVWCQVAQANGNIDPTKPLEYVVSQKAAAEALHLHSILISSGRKIAVINGKEVEVNGRVSNVTITDIQADKVVVNRNGKKIVLTLHGETLRKNASNKVSGR